MVVLQVNLAELAGVGVVAVIRVDLGRTSQPGALLAQISHVLTVRRVNINQTVSTLLVLDVQQVNTYF